MKSLLAALLFCVALTGEETFEQTQQRAVQEQKPLLLIFSGSDWCRPCIQFKNNVLDTDAFSAYANASLVVFVADLPRDTKLLSEEQLAENRALAALYNQKGQFPQLVLFKDGVHVSKTQPGAFTTFEDLKAWLESK
jgi:thioredoxin-related protein